MPRLCCFGSRSEDEKRDHKMEKLLKNVINILLLGSGECGKSTVLKQMRIIYGADFTAEEKRVFTMQMRKNIVETMKRMIEARELLALQYDSPQSRENEEELKIHLCSMFDAEGNFTGQIESPNVLSEIRPLVRALWNDPTLAKCRYNEQIVILDSAMYFMEKLDQIMSPDYQITNDDIVRTRDRTRGVQETQIPAKIGGDKALLRITDVGGQKQERKKWWLVFENIEHLIYMFSLADYCLRMDEDVRANRFDDSLRLFRDIANNDIFRSVTIIVFLNKMDVFKERLEIQQIPLSVCFPDYPPDKFDVEDAASYMQQQIESLDEKTCPDRRLVFHRTTATATENFKVIVNSVIHDIMSHNLKSIGLT